RAIDGRTDASYGSGTQTHSQENEARPWWELDLGSEQPIESLMIWNRTEGLGNRLEGYTLTILDTEQREVFRKADNPAPAPSARLVIGAADPVSALRRAAIRAAVSMTREQAATFTALAGFLARGEEVTAVAQ